MAGFISEWWPASNRNAGRHPIGIGGRIASEFAVHSLFRQGCLLYELIPNMPEERLRPLIERYEELLRQSAVFSEAFGLA